MKRRFWAATALVVALLGTTAAPAFADDDGPSDISVTVPSAEGATAITNAELRWGLNAETGSGAYAGGCNFLSAGTAGSTGSSRAWTAADGFFRSSEGAVSVIKPTARGEWEAATFANKCTDATGVALSSADIERSSGIQVAITAGTGSVKKDGGLEIGWTGSFTIAFYGGMTYWSVTDPVLTLDKSGNGRLVATASGFGAAREDASQWLTLPRQTIVLAEIRGADVASRGFAVVPQYLGVAVSGADQVPRTSTNAAYWGSFPESFVAYQRLTGQLGYWLTTGGAHDAAKPATTLYVNYDAGAPVVTPPVTPPTSGGTGATPSNPVVTKPPTSAVAQAPAAAAAAKTGQAISPLAFAPAGGTMIPLAATGIPPMLFPLLIAGLAVLIGTLAVFSMARLLPWQRRV